MSTRINIIALALASLGIAAPSLAHAQDAETDRASGPARAPPPALAPTPAPTPALTLPAIETTSQWYGWQTLLADGLSVTLFAAALKGDGNAPLLVASAATYFVGTPAIHAAHDRPGTMGVDIALRVGLPVAFAGVGYAVADKRCSNECWFSPATVAAVGGFVLGMGTAVVVDAAVLARERVPVTSDATSDARERERERARNALKPRVTPTAGLTRGGATAGVVGTF